MKTFPILYVLLLLSAHVVAQQPGKALKISQLTSGIYVYTTYKTAGTVTIPSNGMYLVTDKQVVLFDTPWDTAQFQPLLDSIELKHHKPVTYCIVTHYHDDRTAALRYYNTKNINTWSSELTYRLSVMGNFNRADNYFNQDTVFKIDGYSIETYYPGPGHTADNIVIWFAADKVLFAGCLVKSMEYKVLGYSPDTNMAAWPESVRNVMNKFPDAQYVIPGHFNWRDKNSLAHTIKLVKQKQKEE